MAHFARIENNTVARSLSRSRLVRSCLPSLGLRALGCNARIAGRLGALILVWVGPMILLLTFS